MGVGRIRSQGDSQPVAQPLMALAGSSRSRLRSPWSARHCCCVSRSTVNRKAAKASLSLHGSRRTGHSENHDHQELTAVPFVKSRAAVLRPLTFTEAQRI